MLIKCPECDASVSDKAISCPLCGFPMSAKSKSVKTANKKPRKYPKLPNGFGSIKRLSGNRTNPYAVYPPVTEFSLETGSPITPPAISYCNNWYQAFGVLSAYHAGTYKPGDEIIFDDTQITDEFVNTLIAAYNYGISGRKSELDKTFAEVYEDYIKWDFKLSETETDPVKIRRLNTRKNSMRAAFKNCADLHGQQFRSLRYADLQNVVDKCQLKHASKELIIVLLHKMYKYADIAELQTTDYSKHLTIRTDDDDEGGVPFTTEELKKIYAHRDDPTLEMIFIMCLSGFRIRAYKTMDVNLEVQYFKGGVKSRNGIDRIVPIHSGILEMVKNRIHRDGKILTCSEPTFRNLMYQSLEKIGIGKHTPHDCRDTFATICDDANVNKIYLKRLMGHSLSNDITEDKYIHPSLDSLRAEIEKIDLSPIVTND